MEAEGPNFSQGAKRAAVELWKAKVPLKNIREQLQMSERTLRRVLAAAKASPEDPVLRMDNIQYLKNLVELMPRRLQAVIDGNGNLIKY